MASPAAILSVLVKADGIVKTNAQLSGLQGGMKKTGSAAEEMAAKHKKGVDVIGKAAKVGVLAVAGLGAASLKAAGDYEQSLNVFKAVSGATAGEMKKVGRAAIRLGADVHLPGTSAKDAAEAMTELAKGGLSVKDSLAAARPVLQLSAAAQIGNAEAATITARALNAFSLKGRDASKVADLLAGASNASTAEISDIALGMQQAAASAHQLGVPIEDLTTSLGLMANAGVVGADAGTSVKTMLAALVPKSDAAAGLMKKLGLSTFDAQGHFVGLRRAAEIYTKGLAGMTDEQKAATLRTIFGSDAQRAANILLTTGTKKFDDMKAAVTKHGTAQALAAAKTKGFKGSLEAMKSTLETLAITFGTVLLPAATSVLRTFAGLFGGMGAHKTAVLAIVGVIGGLSLAIWTVNLATKAWAATTAAFTAVQAAFNAVLALNPFVLVAIAIAALVAAIIIAYHHSETFRKIIDGLWGVLKAVAGWLITAGVAAFNAIKDAIVFAWNLVKTVTLAVWGAISTYLTNAWGDIHDAAVMVWTPIKNLITGVWNAIKTATVAVWNFIKNNVLVPVWNAIKTIATTEWNFIKGIVTGVWNAIKTVTSAVWNFIKNNVLVPVWNAIKTVATTVWDAIGGVIMAPIHRVQRGLSNIWDAIKTVAVRAFDVLKTAIKAAADPILDVILWPFKQAAKKVGQFAKLILTVIEKIPGVGNDKIDSAKGAIDKLIGGLAQGGVFGQGGIGQLLAAGGLVNKPIVMMGEEAPRHPEYVIPTNPAYRDRAKMLLGQAAKAIGFAAGGVFDATSYGPPWTGINGTGVTATGVNLQGSPHIFGVAVDPSVIALGSQMGIWPNPFGTREKFKAFDTGSAIKGRRLDFYDWRGRDSQYGWGSQQVRVGGGMIAPGIGQIVGNVADALNPLDFIKKLPGLGDLPDWLQGTGKWVLDQVGDYIKSTVASIIPGGGGTSAGPEGIGTFEGMPMANWVIGALKHARANGFTGHPTSGYRSHAQNVAQGRNYVSEHEGTQYPHGAVDFGGFHSGLATKMAAVAATADYKYPLLAPIGFTDDGHASGTGHKMGGILGQGTPFVGSYGRGGTVPADGLGYLHQGETVTPKDGGALAGALERNTAMMERLVASGMAGVMAAIADEVSDRTGAIVGLRSQAVGIPGAVA